MLLPVALTKQVNLTFTRRRGRGASMGSYIQNFKIIETGEAQQDNRPFSSPLSYMN